MRRVLVVIASLILWGSLAGKNTAAQPAAEGTRQVRDRCAGFKSGTFSTIELAKPVRLREVVGTIELDLGGRGEPQFLPEVFFQVCGAATKYEILSVSSDADGRFRMAVPWGQYTFVAAKDGYQSVKGTLLVSRWSLHRTIRVRLPLGL